MRYPEEFPKAYRRKGIRQKRAEDTRGRRQEGGSFPHQNRVITIPSLADKQDQGVDTGQDWGGKTGLWNENYTNQRIKSWQFREITVILRRQNGDKARTCRF